MGHHAQGTARPRSDRLPSECVRACGPSLLVSITSQLSYQSFTFTLYFSHNAELFSKNAFSAGSYINKDMAELDMTNERDYATYMALVSSGQGKNSEKMLEKLKTKLGNKTWIEYCRDINS